MHSRNLHIIALKELHHDSWEFTFFCFVKGLPIMTTIQDIADKMGVSKSTVSKALNDAPDITMLYGNRFWKLP